MRGRRWRSAAGSAGTARLRWPRSLAGLGAVVLAGCAQGGARPGRAALTVYSGQHVQTTRPWWRRSSGRPGSRVNLRSDDEDVLADQIVTEGSHSPADVFFTENSPPLQYLASKGLLAAVDPSTLANTPSRYNSPDGHWVGVSARVSVMIYNTSLLKPAELPTSAMELADPKWSGQIGIAGSETDFQPIVTSIARTYGDDAALRWLEAVKANAGGHDYPYNETHHRRRSTAGRSPWASSTSTTGTASGPRSGPRAIHSAIAYFAPHDVGYVVDVSGAGILKSSRAPGRRPSASWPS